MEQTIFELGREVEGKSLSFTGGEPDLGFEFRRLEIGVSAGVDVVTLKCGKKKVQVIPTRGMGIAKAQNGEIEFGWHSPIRGPVHPNWVPVNEPSGIGWLDGFDELMVRCGLASNGAPEFDVQGNLVWPLHGRIANLPAEDVAIDIDEAAGRIAIRGTVNENRFHIQRLQLQTEISMQLDSDEVSVKDRITNLSDRPSNFQILYHNNFGPPVLGTESCLHAPVKKLVPRNDHAAKGIQQWNEFGPPAVGFAEQVYFMELASDDHGHSIVVLSNNNQSIAASVRYDATALPCFSLWKNTVGLADGYVAGLEPATNFPNPKSFEQDHDRVVNLEPGESREFTMSIGMLVDPVIIRHAIDNVESLSAEQPEIHKSPDGDWCSPD